MMLLPHDPRGAQLKHTKSCSSAPESRYLRLLVAVSCTYRTLKHICMYISHVLILYIYARIILYMCVCQSCTYNFPCFYAYWAPTPPTAPNSGAQSKVVSWLVDIGKQWTSDLSSAQNSSWLILRALHGGVKTVVQP